MFQIVTAFFAPRLMDSSKSGGAERDPGNHRNGYYRSLDIGEDGERQANGRKNSKNDET
jgi:hypothetical protein